MSDDDIETIEDIDPDAVGFNGESRAVYVQDGDETVVYSGDEVCFNCPSDSIGVAVATLVNDRVIHSPVCEQCFETEFEQGNFKEIEIRYYD
jgi:hypothetical protein